MRAQHNLAAPLARVGILPYAPPPAAGEPFDPVVHRIHLYAHVARDLALAGQEVLRLFNIPARRRPAARRAKAKTKRPSARRRRR